MKTTIHLIRHGEVHNPKQILYGRLPHFRLSERGVAEANAVATVLAKQDIEQLYCSPMLRARQTARIIGQQLNLEPQQSRLLNEVHSPYEGQPLAELEAIDWNMYEGIASEYEQPKDIVARLLRFINRVRRQYPNKTIVGVTHGDIVVFARLWALQKPLTHTERRAIDPYPQHVSINSLIFHDNDAFPEFSYQEVVANSH